MSYINNHKAAYEKLQSIEEVDAQHISLYHAFFYQFNKFGWPDHLLIPRDNLMFMAKIGSTNTFYKKVRQLDKWGFIKYKPSKNPLIGSRYTYIKCDTSGDTSTDTSGGISTDTSTDTSSDTLIRPKDYKTKRPKDKCKYEFSDLWDDYDLGDRTKGNKKQAVEYWNKLSVEDREAAVENMEKYLQQTTRKDGQSFGRQVKYYLRDKEWEGISKTLHKINIPEKYQKDIDRALPYCDDWGISKEVKLWTSPNRDEPLVTLGGLSVWYFRSYATEYAQALEYYKDKELIAEEWKRKIEEGLRETKWDTNKMTEI